MDEGKTKIGYEIYFTRHDYKPSALRSLVETRADIETLERGLSAAGKPVYAVEHAANVGLGVAWWG